jgi:nitroimidazol reductase NimA-like FMN-containing flavoprotein (pyridoxamine 5'-phosphate oxidase superfamily)
MPEYGVETDQWRALPWSWAAQRLIESRNYWLVTVSAAGRPHALPVWGVWDDDEHRFGFSCAPRSRKAANIRANRQVSFAPESTVEAVSVEGTAVLVSDEPRREWWIERYLTKYRPISPELGADFLRANVIVEVAPERAFAIIEREPEFATRATRWRFPAGSRQR